MLSVCLLTGRKPVPVVPDFATRCKQVCWGGCPCSSRFCHQMSAGPMGGRVCVWGGGLVQCQVWSDGGGAWSKVQSGVGGGPLVLGLGGR